MTVDVREQLRDWWDRDAATYERSPSHSLAAPAVRAAWADALARHLPPPPAHVLDAGAGTGAITMILAELGYRVTALDFSREMLAQAERKVTRAGLDATFVLGDVTHPPSGPFDAVVERHVLWTQPDPVAALEAWRAAAPGGRLVLYESLRPPTVGRRLRTAAASVLQRAMGRPPDHHAGYEPGVVAALPLAGAASLDPLIQSLARAGLRRYRVERLRDVERTRHSGSPVDHLIGRLEAGPSFAILAE